MRERSKQRVRKLTSFLMPIAMLGSLLVGMATPVAAEETPTTPTSVADTSTLNAWTGTTGNNTKNMGRIWTDKTVSTESLTLSGTVAGRSVSHNIEIGDSDFLIAYSALSSTAQISTQQAISEPLDIVLVLDKSSSMGQPGTAGTTANSLKTAAGEFISDVLEKNAGVTAENQHRIAIVRFGGNYKEDSYSADKETKITADFTANSNLLSAGLDEATVYQSGTQTASNLGLQLAADLFEGGVSPNNKEELDLVGAREGAKKVVVFFTDGVPTDPDGGSDFDAAVAAEAINIAQELKADGVTIYSVGVFEGGDGGSGSDINTYMNAVSSNYPDATADVSGGTNVITLGSQADDKYYFESDNAGELNSMFDSILQDIITKPNSSPTVVGEGNDGTHSGYITFTDTLGDYMKVDDFKQIVFADRVFVAQDAPQTETTGTGSVITYKFTSDPVHANDIYPDGDVADIIIKVTKFTTLQQGDVVTVQIPASMIPLRKYEVDVTATGTATTTITDTYPIRLFYGVSVKPGAKEALAKLNTDKENEIAESDLPALKAYVAANNDGKGHVKFYSNKYDSTDPLTVYSQFQPATTNDFYYFQADTPLYTDTNCQTPATGAINTDATYYYRQTYYSEDATASQTQTFAVTGATILAANGNIGSDAANGNALYVKAGSRKLTPLQTHAINKLPLPPEGQTPDGNAYYNNTNTAGYVTSPNWDAAAAGYVDVALGNNGALFAAYTPAPATLDGDTNLMVTKTLNGREWQAGDEFTFELSASTEDGVQLPTDKTLTINNETSDHKAAFGNVTFTKAGKYTLTIKEKPGDLSNMKYDSTPKTISVEVTYGTDGALMAAATGDKNPTFTNVYTKPAAPETPKPSTTTTTTVTSQAPAATPAPTAAPATKPAPTATPAATVIPQTGDESEPMVWVTLMGVSALALVALAVYRKKRSSK